MVHLYTSLRATPGSPPPLLVILFQSTEIAAEVAYGFPIASRPSGCYISYAAAIPLAENTGAIMEFKSVFPARKYYKYSETEAGTVLATGIYKGPVEGTYGTQHIIREADGTEVVLNKAGHLDFLLAKAGKGTTVQVVYLGEGIVTKGKFKNKKVHNFDVQVATTQEGDNTNE